MKYKTANENENENENENMNESKWKSMASMSKKRNDVGYTVIDDNRFVVLGGNSESRKFSSGEMYDRRTNKWTNLPNDMQDSSRYACAAASIDNKVYVVGGTIGFVATNSLFALDMETLEWETLPSMKQKRTSCAAVAFGRFIYVFGGYRDDTAERYNVDTQQWESIPSMPTIRWCCAAVTVQNKIYVIGGDDCGDGDDAKRLATVEVFDVNTQTWESPSSVSDMAVARKVCSAVVLDGRFVVVMGGLDESYNRIPSVEVLDTSTGKWTTSPHNSRTSRSYHGAVVLDDSTVYIFGGCDGSNFLATCESIPSSFFLPASNIVEVLDDEVSVPVNPVRTVSSARSRKRKAQEEEDKKEEEQSRETVSEAPALSRLQSSTTSVKYKKANENADMNESKWKSMPSMSTERNDAECVVIDDNRFVVLGGWDVSRALSSGEMYDRRTNKWTKLPNDMPDETVGCAAASIDNKVYVVGGKRSGVLDSNSVFALDTETLEWEALPSMKKERIGCEVAAVGRFIYVFGTYSDNTAERYNVDTQLWEDLPSMSTIRWYCTAVAVQNKIYVIGGFDGTQRLASVEVFDVNTQKWESPSSVNDMSVAKNGHAGVVLDGRFVVVMGGRDKSCNKISSVEVLDTFTGNWTTSSHNMISPRASHGAVLLGDSTVYAFGGNDGSNCLAACESTPSSFFLPASNIVEVLDDEVSVPVNHVRTVSSARSRKRKAQEEEDDKDKKEEEQSRETASEALALSSLPSSTTSVKHKKANENADMNESKWKSMPSISKERSQVGCAVIDDHRFVVLGGCSGSRVLSSGEMYDRSTNKWTNLPNGMPDDGRAGYATALIDNKVYVMGGNDGEFEKNSLFALDTETLEWETLPSMKKERVGCAAVAVGRFIYVFGGYSDNTAERYNVDTQQWEDLPSMPTIRWYCAAVAVQNKIYVIGGSDSTKVLAAVEVFDVDMQEWESPSSVNDMSAARHGCSAVVLDGRFVVVMGGLDKSYNEISSVEVLDTFTGNWTTSSHNMISPRASHGAVLLGDSTVYAFGGYDGSNYSPTCATCESIPSSFFLPKRKAQDKDKKEEEQSRETVLEALALSSLHSSITSVQEQQRKIRNERHKWLMTKTENPGLTAVCDQQLAQIEKTEKRLIQKEELMEEQYQIITEKHQER